MSARQQTMTWLGCDNCATTFGPAGMTVQPLRRQARAAGWSAITQAAGMGTIDYCPACTARHQATGALHPAWVDTP